MKKSVKTIPGILAAAGIITSMFSLPASAVTYVDDLGRTINLPSTIDSWAPSGILAQLALYSVDPDLLAGWAQAPSVAQQSYIDSAYWSLPVFGQIYGTASTPSGYDETAVVNSGADVIIDIGQVKGTVQDMADDFDDLQDSTGIPVVFINADDIDEYAHIYAELGEILGSTAITGDLEDYCEDVINYIDTQSGTIPSIVSNARTVYYGEGSTGLLTNGTTGSGAIHQNILPFIGAVNVANINSPSGSGRTPVDIEDVQGWDPDIIIFGPGSYYDSVATDTDWEDIAAVEDDHYAEVPDALYNWIDRPPSINRILGAQWLAHIIFPEYYSDFDTYTEFRSVVIDFYDLFYHYSMTTTEADAILANAEFGDPY